MRQNIPRRSQLSTGKQAGDLDVLAWMSQNEKQVREYSGKWIAVRLPDGIVASGSSLSEVTEEWHRRYPHQKPFVFMVPSEREGAFVS